MALATRCPHCGTRFRVATDQLKLRGGKVRCGACRGVFDATASLDTIEAPRGNTIGGGTAPDTKSDFRETLVGVIASESDALVAQTATARARDPASPEPDPRDPDGLPRSDEDIDGAAAPDGDGPGAAAPEPEPEFLRRTRPRAWVRRALATASALLLLTLLAQGAWIGRTQILTQFPSLRPVAARACARVGCALPWPRRTDQIAIIGTELQTLPGTEVIELDAVLRNRADFTVATPALELTLSDASNHPLVRRVFLAAEFAPPGAGTAPGDPGIGPGADQAVHLAFEAHGLAAVNYVLYPFYP